MDSPSLAEVIRVADFRASLRAFLRDTEKIAAHHGLTPQRYLLLLMIKGAPDGSERSTVTELTSRLQIAQHTVTELVARAEKAGLVRREASAIDRRVVHIRLTPKGERLLTRSFGDLAADRRMLRELVARLEP
ncbi:MAG TPA: MarR family transcriptional regulator [Candidatus Sulfotelmatobacter sp.]|nr:MarR family transcriptional regulator [Candidatus Sulfotelmatobacter sp.]